MTDQERSLLDALYRVDTANENVQFHFPDLERVLSDEVMSTLKLALRNIDKASEILVATLGGSDRVARLQCLRDEEDEE